MTDSATPRFLVKRDAVLWLRHLAEHGLHVPVGAAAIFAVNGVEVLFEPMRTGADGRPTKGLRAVGQNRAVWNAIALEATFELRLVQVVEASPTANAGAMPRTQTRAPEPQQIGPASVRLTSPRGREPSFDCYIMIDWSASSVPKDGKDSVWWCHYEWDAGDLVSRRLENPRTRRECVAVTSDLAGFISGGKSVLVGFDFPFGYPAGFTAALGLTGTRWQALWSELDHRIQDLQSVARNNRFSVASDLNIVIGAEGGPFWGRPEGTEFEHLFPTEPDYPVAGLPRLRLAEGLTRSAQPTWKLWGNGSVGGQALLGIPYLAQLRENAVLRNFIRVWPFETGCVLPPRNDEPRIILAEIYPSLVPLSLDLAGEVKDRVQVETMAQHLARHDAEDSLDELFEAPRRLSSAARRAVVEEEGWILGVVPPSVVA